MKFCAPRYKGRKWNNSKKVRIGKAIIFKSDSLSTGAFSEKNAASSTPILHRRIIFGLLSRRLFFPKLLIPNLFRLSTSTRRKKHGLLFD
jgi:hypothetical protein